VLGPPTDPKFRRNLKVPADWGMYARTPGASGVNSGLPFSAEWLVPSDRLPSRRPFQEKTLDAIRLFNDDLFYAAKAVDGFLNGESIVLVLEVGRRWVDCVISC